jgi:hypothetical protein
MPQNTVDLKEEKATKRGTKRSHEDEENDADSESHHSRPDPASRRARKSSTSSQKASPSSSVASQPSTAQKSSVSIKAAEFGEEVGGKPVFDGVDEQGSPQPDTGLSWDLIMRRERLSKGVEESSDETTESSEDDSDATLPSTFSPDHPMRKIDRAFNPKKRHLNTATSRAKQ